MTMDRTRTRTAVRSAVIFAIGAAVAFLSLSAACNPFTAAAVSSDSGAIPNDGGNEGETATSASCDATFCDDFDRGVPFALWTSKTVLDGGELLFDTLSWRSAPQSLHAHAVKETEAWLERSISAPGGLRCSFDLLLLASDASGPAFDLFGIVATRADVTHYWQFGYLINEGFNIREDVVESGKECECPRQSTFRTLEAPPQRWTRVTIETDFTQASIAYDGQIRASGPFFGLTPSTTSIRLGIRRTSAALDARFDNVVCDALAIK